MVISSIREERAKDIAKLHVEGIRNGFISSLGIDFVTSLYRAIVQTESSFGFTAEENDRIVGFVALSADLNRLYKTVIFKNAPTFSLLLARKVFSLKRLNRMLETLLYPHRIEKLNLPRAELLSIVVAADKRRKGLATALMRETFAECSFRAIGQVKVLVGADNEPANRLYLRCGFELADRINNHGVASNIYIAETDLVLKMLAPAELAPTEEPRPGKPEIVGIPSKSAAEEKVLAKRTDESDQPSN